MIIAREPKHFFLLSEASRRLWEALWELLMISWKALCAAWMIECQCFSIALLDLTLYSLASGLKDKGSSSLSTITYPDIAVPLHVPRMSPRCPLGCPPGCPLEFPINSEHLESADGIP